MFFTVGGALGVIGLMTSSTYGNGAGAEPGEQSDPIHKLTQHEIIFGAGYKMTRIDLSDVDKPR